MSSRDSTPTTAKLTDWLVQGVEANEPGAVYGRLNPGSIGFRVQVDGELFAVRIERLRGFWDADLTDAEAVAGMFDDEEPEAGDA